MAKSSSKKVAKKAKKTIKGLGKSLRDHGFTTSKPSKTISDIANTSSDVRKHIESLSKARRDAAIIWPQIKDGKLSENDIKKLVKERGFDTLLGELP